MICLPNLQLHHGSCRNQTVMHNLVSQPMVIFSFVRPVIVRNNRTYVPVQLYAYVLSTYVRARYIRTSSLISSKLYSNLLYSTQNLIISNTPLGLERSLSSRPVGQSKPLSFELCTLHRLGQDVRKHVFSAQVFQHDFFLCYFLAQPEVANIDVP